MSETFHLIDLVSQAGAVQRLLRGKSVSEKLAWLSARGKVLQMEKKDPMWPDTYFFESTIGAECAFILQDGDIILFVGDNHCFTVPIDKDA